MKFSVRDNLSPKTTLLIFKLVGALLLSVAVFWAWKTHQFINNAQKATGEVMYNEENLSNSTKGKSRVSYYPVVKFKNSTGVDIIFKSSTGTNPPSFEAGEQVEIYYELQNPKNAEIASFWNLWLILVILGFLGLVFLMVSFFAGKFTQNSI